MLQINRRVFAKGAVITGLALFAPPSNAQQRTKANGFVHGKIIAIDRNIVYISDDQGLPATLHLDETSDIWKGRHQMAYTELLVGDDVSASGMTTEPGEYIVIELYVNIVNIYGRITRVNGREFELLPYMVVDGEMLIAPLTRVICDFKGVSTDIYYETGVRVESGRMARLVGCIEPDGRIQATRLWVFLKHRSLEPQRILL